MAKQASLPLCEKYWYKHRFFRAMDILILLLLLLLLAYRTIAICLNNYMNYTWLFALLCESWFAFSWVLVVSTKWSPAKIITYPDRLFQRLSEAELPPVDLFVTTADPVLEPPIITVNTVLSLMAIEYPSHKLACYVSDDGCSPLTFYALVQATKFAKLWVPFCKRYDVQVRAPFRYFSDEAVAVNEESSPEFKQEWLQMKDTYEQLSSQIAGATRNLVPSEVDGELAVFSNTERNNHPTIIKVLWENKEGLSDGLPHLIYISREKCPKHPHHYKAGAINVLTRVSGLITNAPYMLNVDCDMFVNNPKIILHAMCILLDPKGQKEVAFVQCPQKFFDGLKDDPFGNQMVVLYAYLGAGFGGLQGPMYAGTNCFHRRRVIYGLSPTFEIDQGKTSGEDLIQKFGVSKEFMKSAADALEEKTNPTRHDICKSLEAASQVASCGYEYGSRWGTQVGWIYGSQTEDVLTGLTIHTKGWRSEMCTPDPIAFTGCAPVGGPSSLTQQKRWATGVLELFFSKHSPILGTIFGKLQFRESLGYMWIINWGLRSVPEVCYATLLAYCTITNSNLFPKERGLWIPIASFVTYNIYTILEYSATRLSIRAWWNNQRMSRIIAMNAWFSGFLTAIIKLLGISDTVFEITRKDQSTIEIFHFNSDAGRFTFNESLIFVPGTTILLLHLVALVFYFSELQPNACSENNGFGLLELICNAYLIICYWPFLKGLFGKGKYGIPLPTICKSAVLAFIFVYFCKSSVMVD